MIGFILRYWSRFCGAVTGGTIAGAVGEVCRSTDGRDICLVIVTVSLLIVCVHAAVFPPKRSR